MKNTLLFLFLILAYACPAEDNNPIPILIDTDANNELDDQHALAYAFFNREVFDIKGITINATRGGGDVEQQYAEGKRVMQLCNVWDSFPLRKGANGNFAEISAQLHLADHDGHEAVDFIIQEALNIQEEKLVLIPIGKLTNIALAIKKAPEIIDKIRIVWLGSNFPDPGEYNLENDIAAMNYILMQDVPFEMVVVRGGKTSGSDFVRVTPEDISTRMKEKGPKVLPVQGRHGGTFTTFGDYSINLFSNIKLRGEPPSRALYDVVAIATVKHPDWAEKRLIPAPTMENKFWKENPGNKRQIILWENFNKRAILKDFFESMKKANS